MTRAGEDSVSGLAWLEVIRYRIGSSSKTECSRYSAIIQERIEKDECRAVAIFTDECEGVIVRGVKVDLFAN